ncbi:WD40-repeat-containing domain protein [Xylaria sp. FL1042]|nr:WD40-repeat-containing domain protein [Xylaria sp. FL1042]
MSHEAALPGRLRREHVLNPITALAFLTLAEGQYLLAAEDTDIKVYDVATSRLRGALPIFRAQPIHGISVPLTAEDDGSKTSNPRRPPQILVWGSQAVKVLPGRIVEELITASCNGGDNGSLGNISGLLNLTPEVPEAIAPDWIFDGRISPFDDNRIVLLTAHNEVIQGHVSTDEKTLVLGRVQSPSRPVLYSGNFFWVGADCVLVAAGTVFGEIVVWKCHLSSDVGINGSDYGGLAKDAHVGRETVGCEVLFMFSGHEGSIFGVHISPEICTSTGETIRLLASCSDDRTIRIWDITEGSDGPTSEGSKYETQISDARQTGFGDSIIGSTGLADSSSRCVAMAMGHISRIWQVEINCLGPFSRGDPIEVYSFGEDGTMQRWHLELNFGQEFASNTSKIGGVLNSPVQPLSKLTHHEIFSNHSGKHIWSHAMTANEKGLLIATGGGDGKIALIGNISAHAPRAAGSIGHYPQAIQELDVSPTSVIETCEEKGCLSAPSISSFKHGNGKEMFQSFAFVTGDILLITTRSGRIFQGNFNNYETEWKELIIPDAIRTAIQSYTILRTSTKSSTAFIGAPNGELFCYHEASGNMLHSIHKVERKITDIICLSDTLASSHHTGYDHEGNSNRYIEVLVTVFGSTKAELLRLNRNHDLVLRADVNTPDKFIVTAAAWCHKYLILGSRNGQMSVFGQATNRNYAVLLTIEVKIGDKITSIHPLPKKSEHSPHYFLTTARDGKYRIYEILDTTNNLHVRLLHEMKPPFGPMIEGSWLFDKGDGKHDLLLYGFRSKYFVIWNVTHQNEVATIDCGGGHRVFDQVQIEGNPDGFRFACTKASQMKIFSQTRAPHLPLKMGGHGREIKSVSAASRKYVATGAEDTTIRIWDLGGRNSGEQQLRCVLSLEKHNTGIQKLQWYKDQYLFSSGGNEEFFVWRITALESDICPLGVVCEAVFPDRSEVGDLRITDFDVQCLNEDSSTTEGDTLLESEKPRPEVEFCISMTLSNSTIQSYLYSARRGFQLLGRRMYTGACLTQLRHLNFIDQCYPQVLTAATDGHLVIFTDVQTSENETEDSTDVLVTKLHQSGIKSLDMRSITSETGTSYLVVTGGDDDAIGILHLFSPRPLPSFEPTSIQAVTGNSNSIMNPAPLPKQKQNPVSALSPERTPAEDSPHVPQPPTPTQRQGHYEVRGKFIVRSAHAAAVTGLGIVRLENGDRDAVVATTSNDQRVKTWRLVDWRSASPKVHLLDDRYSGVADAGDLEVIRESYENRGERIRDTGRGEGVLVAGVGIEAWEVS